MKFGKNLIQVVELSDPEWGPFWINYKFLKKKINDIVDARGGVKVSKSNNSNPSILSKSACEVEFFRALKMELKKTSDFFASSEKLYRIRHERVVGGYQKLLEEGNKYDKNTWSRLLRACVKFYKDVLLLENFAIMNYCGFSKILKKHDKLTGFDTREAFMRNVMSVQNFTHYPYLLELLKKSEQLFAEIQGMDSVMPLQEEERLFIDAIRDLNYQASQLQEEENGTLNTHNSDGSDGDDNSDTVPTHSQNQHNIGNKQVVSTDRVKGSGSGNGKSCSTFTMITNKLTSDLLHSRSVDTLASIGDDPDLSVTSRLDSAADAALIAANRMRGYSDGGTPDVHSACFWMQAIIAKKPKVIDVITTNTSTPSNNSTPTNLSPKEVHVRTLSEHANNSLNMKSTTTGATVVDMKTKSTTQSKETLSNYTQNAIIYMTQLSNKSPSNSELINTTTTTTTVAALPIHAYHTHTNPSTTTATTTTSLTRSYTDAFKEPVSVDPVKRTRY